MLVLVRLVTSVLSLLAEGLSRLAPVGVFRERLCSCVACRLQVLCGTSAKGLVMVYAEETLFVVVVANEFGDVEDRIPCYTWAEVVDHMVQLQVRGECGYEFTVKTVARG